MNEKALIEEIFPISQISEISSREKGRRHGSLSTFHLWWARRPLSASRTTSYSALVPAPASKKELYSAELSLIQLANLNSSSNFESLSTYRESLIANNGGNPPRILDPFSGGGSIPFEAMRLGCDTYAMDYNPVAYLILKCVLDYPHKYGKPEIRLGVENNANYGYDLLGEVRKWSSWILQEVRKEISELYSLREDSEYSDSTYIWSKQMTCLNPACGTKIPLLSNYWLSNKSKKKIALFPRVSNNEIIFNIVGDGYETFPKGFNPDVGSISRARVKCLVCGTIIDEKSLRKFSTNGGLEDRLVAIVSTSVNKTGNKYRIAEKKDQMLYRKAFSILNLKKEELLVKWGLEPIPNEPITRVPVSFGVINIWVYGINEWGNLFNKRQQLTMITFVDKIRDAYSKMIDLGYEKEYAKAIALYLAINLDNFAEKNNTLNRWVNTVEAVAGCYAMQALPMRWSYAEGNPFFGNISWEKLLEFKIPPIFEISRSFQNNVREVIHGSATSIHYSDGFFDAVITDPPYYDNVPYSYLSDFFYVWLKRSVGYLFPDLFATPLTPKGDEIVAYNNKGRNQDSGKQFFENKLKLAFSEVNRILKPNGVSIIVYAHQSLDGWETLINSLLSSGLVVTATWPIHTEMKDRMRSKDSAALASSIYIVCRKIKKKNVGFYHDVINDIKSYLDGRLKSLWESGISGADLFISAIGSSIEIFGLYENIIDDQGASVLTSRLLEEIRKMVTNFAVKQVLQNGFANEIETMTRFYIIWRWAYGNLKAPFDEARKLGQSLALDISSEWHKGLIKKDKDFISVLGPEERNVDKLEKSNDLIDVLHYVLIQWKLGHSDKLDSKLRETGYGSREIFYKVAQAISETLPKESSERKLIEGFLTGKERIIREMRKEVGQRRLF